MNASRQAGRRIKVVGIAPVTRRVGRRVAPRIVVEIAIAETEVGRERDAAPRGRVDAGNGARLDDKVGNGILGTRALVLERAVGPPAIDPEKPAIPAPREREGADKASSGADEFREVRFFVAIVRKLSADFPPTPGEQWIALLCRSCRGKEHREDGRDRENFFQAAAPFAML